MGKGKECIPSPFIFTILTHPHLFHEILKKEPFMGWFSDKVWKLSRLINFLSGVTLAFIMFLTVADIILRSFRRPIVGTYEIVAFSGAVVIGFSVPYTSWMRAHVYTDFLILRFSQKIRNVFNIVTRCLSIVLFILIGWNLIKYGMDLKKAGEVSLTLTMPFYPIAYGVGVCCFIQCLVMVCDILKIFGGKYE
jgi:TRAP-type C4-dicarboxylate transport system permease small subunit